MMCILIWLDVGIINAIIHHKVTLNAIFITRIIKYNFRKTKIHNVANVNIKVGFQCCVLFTCVSKIETMYERPCVNTKVEGGFPLSRNFYVRTDVNLNWLYTRK